RPLDREAVAAQGRRIGVADRRPGEHSLAALLIDEAERDEGAGREREAGLLDELAPGGRERIFVGLDQTLGNCPGAGVLAGEERAAGVDQQVLERAGHRTTQQQPGAALARHAQSSTSGSASGAVRVSTISPVSTSSAMVLPLRTSNLNEARSTPRARVMSRSGRWIRLTAGGSLDSITRNLPSA